MLDVLDEPGEELAPLRVDGGLLMLRGRPLGMAAHVRSLTIDRPLGPVLAIYHHLHEIVVHSVVVC